MTRLLKVSKSNLKSKFKAAILFTLLVFALAIPVVAVTWSDHETRLTNYADFDGVPCIIETSDGTLWIFWTRNIAGDYNLFYTTSTDFAQTTQLTLDGNADVGVSAFQASDGSIWIVWASDRTGNYDLYYKISSDLGAFWSNDTQLTFHSSHDMKPVIRQMSDGSIWIVWGSSRSGGYDLYLKKSFDNGASWSEDIQLTADSGLDKMPSLIQTSDGTIWIVWASDRTGNYDLYYKTSSDLGASWSDNTQLTNGPNVDSNPSILQLVDGQIWVFWSSRKPSETATDDIYYLYSSDNGVTWSDGYQFTTDEYDDIWPSVVQTRFVKMWVVWTSDRADQPDYGNWEIYYKTSLAGDVNGDGIVNVIDLTIVALAYGSFWGEPEYNPDADLNKDGFVGMRDIIIIAYYLGET